MFIAMLWIVVGLGFSLYAMKSGLEKLQRMEISLTGTFMVGIGLVLAQLELM